MKLAPIGIAAKMFAKASADMTQFQEINFSNNPISVNAVVSLHGFKFTRNNKETVLIINVGDTNFSNVAIGSLFNFTTQASMNQYYSNEPYISGVFEGNSNIISSTTNVATTVNINKFSISVIEKVAGTLGIENKKINPIFVYPNPVKDAIRIQSDEALLSVAVYNLLGQSILDSKIGADNTVDLSALQAGHYILKIETGQGLDFQKIIKE
jgi:hypothetical protein